MFTKHTPVLTTYECTSILKPLTDSITSQALNYLLDGTVIKSDLDNCTIAVTLNKGFKNDLGIISKILKIARCDDDKKSLTRSLT